MKIELSEQEVGEAVRGYLRRKSIEATVVKLRSAARGKTTSIVAEVEIQDKVEGEASDA